MPINDLKDLSHEELLTEILNTQDTVKRAKLEVDRQKAAADRAIRETTIKMTEKAVENSVILDEEVQLSQEGLLKAEIEYNTALYVLKLYDESKYDERLEIKRQIALMGKSEM